MNSPQHKGSPVLNSDVIGKVYRTLLANENIKEALQFVESDHSKTIENQIQLTEIPASPFHEGDRQVYFKKCLEDLGLLEIRTDAEGNVFGVQRGCGSGPKIFVSAHLDTVFPDGTNARVLNETGNFMHQESVMTAEVWLSCWQYSGF